MSTVCVDFDGVLAQYDGWKGEAVLGDPAPGALDFVRRLLTEHYRVIVHTTRDCEQIRRWLREHGLQVWVDETCELQVWNEKPPALVYIDDRGFRFTGDWEAAYRAIKEPAWWERSKEP